MKIKVETQLNNQPKWQRIILLSVLGYEALGGIVGGTLLITSPDGRYMDMPVEIMHGVFSDFLIPGIILLLLGILNAFAFRSVLLKSHSDWLMAGIALGGWVIWFVVEIIILQELHWLHLMWGVPVLWGITTAIPLIVLRNDTAGMKKGLLICGILSTLWYLAINIFVPTQYEGYSIITFTVSELSAIGSPTRILWVLPTIFYPLLLVAFGWGVLKSAEGNHALRVAGTLIIAYSIFNFYWPPMHMREVIAAGGGTITDTLHLVWAMITLLFMMFMMGFGAAALGKRFRFYTIATWIVFIVFGILTFKESPGIEANLPTPHLGIWERINMGAFFLWVVVFANALLHREKISNSFGRSED